MHLVVAMYILYMTGPLALYLPEDSAERYYRKHLSFPLSDFYNLNLHPLGFLLGF
jgi:hypothetical protein